MSDRKSFVEEGIKERKHSSNSEPKQSPWKKRVDSTTKSTEDDDEGGGGGAGKKHRGNYRKEKLLKMFDRGGPFKAKNFHKILNQHGLDQHEVKKTDVTKDLPEKTQQQDEQRAKEELEQAKERREAESSLESDFQSEQPISKSDIAKGEAAKWTQTFFDQKNAVTNPYSAAASQVYTRGVPGLPHEGNYIGFAVQQDIAGSEASSTLVREARQGSVKQGTYVVVSHNPVTLPTHISGRRANVSGTPGNTNTNMNTNPSKQDHSADAPAKAPTINRRHR